MWSNGHDTNSDGESILLLQPITDNKRSKHIKQSPSSSYIGGVPRYHENDTLVLSSIGSSKFTNPQCSKCNKSMYLLLQLHAPVDDYDRSLYVFGCNNNACHSYKDENDGGNDNTIKRFHPCIGIDGPLRCFRSQTSWTATTASTDTSSKVVSSSKVKNVDLADNDWGLEDDNASDEWGDDGDDDWGEGNNNKDVSMNDLEDMLTKCEMQSTSKKIEHKQQLQTAKVSQPSSNDSNKSTDKQVNDAPSFDHYDLDMFNEPHNGNTNDSDDEDDVVDSSDVDQMLSRYLDMEDDEEILSVLKGGDTNNSSSSNNNDKGGGGGGERYERLPPDERALLAFTNRLKHAPKQVARYAYGGTPLWSIPLPPKQQQQKSNNKPKKKNNKPQKVPFPDVPNCSCGAKRLFEFQIIPSLLHVLDVDSHTTQGSKDINMDVDDLISTGGMDWGCIAVYSCSESCAQSREEFVIVQQAIGDEPIKKAKPANVDNDEDMDE